MYLRKIIYAVLLGALCALFVLVLKQVTEFSQQGIFTALTFQQLPAAWVLCPILGLILILVLNRLVFQGHVNNGLAEVLSSIRDSEKRLPPLKIAAHFFNGIITLASGGSTGIEVSTVISTATVGSMGSALVPEENKFRKQMMIAGAAAGIAVLFNSPAGGIFFAFEVLADSISMELILVVVLAVTSGWLLSLKFDNQILFRSNIQTWQGRAVPYYLFFAGLAGVISAYFTFSVVSIKAIFKSFLPGLRRAMLGGLLVGISLLFFASIFGEGYPVVREMALGNFSHLVGGESFHATHKLMLGVLILLILKPLATSLTLAAGGDGGVFAPSIFLGAVAGYLYSHLANLWFGAGLVEVNFIVVGMAAVLGATIQAPLTAIFLVFSITQGYALAVPLFLTCYVSIFVARKIIPYTVYSYALRKPNSP